jgi:hypothetical protein
MLAHPYTRLLVGQPYKHPLTRPYSFAGAAAGGGAAAAGAAAEAEPEVEEVP